MVFGDPPRLLGLSSMTTAPQGLWRLHHQKKPTRPFGAGLLLLGIQLAFQVCYLILTYFLCRLKLLQLSDKAQRAYISCTGDTTRGFYIICFRPPEAFKSNTSREAHHFSSDNAKNTACLFWYFNWQAYYLKTNMEKYSMYLHEDLYSKITWQLGKKKFAVKLSLQEVLGKQRGKGD